MKKMSFRTLPILFFCLVFTMGLSMVRAQDVGITEAIQPLVDQGKIPGAVLLVGSFEGEILAWETIGWSDIETQKPIEKNSTCWIASMSKAVTAAAFMILVDEGKISPDDTIESIFPEFKNIKVAQQQEDGSILLVPPTAPPTFRQALSHTAGFPFITPLMQRFGLDTQNGEQLAFTIAVTPLIHQPGTKYQYSNLGIDLAGIAVEKITGKSLEDFMKERLFDPLDMPDTTFFPNAEQQKRLASSYTWKDSKLQKETGIYGINEPYDNRVTRFEEGGGGLFGTAQDYYHFFMMLAGNGVYQGKRILSPEAVREMTSNQTGSLGSYGFGLNIEENSYIHGGMYGTCARVRLDRRVIEISMVQLHSVPAAGEYRKLLDHAILDYLDNRQTQ